MARSSTTGDSGFMEVTGSNTYQIDFEMNKLKKANNDLHAEIERLKKQIECQTSKFEKDTLELKQQRRSDLTAKNREQDELRLELEAKKRGKKKLEKKLRDMDVDAKNKDFALADSNRRVEELEAKLETLQRKMKEWKKKGHIPSANKQYRAQQDELEQSREEIEDLKSRLREMQEMVEGKDTLLKETMEQNNENVRKMTSEMEAVKGAMAEQAGVMATQADDINEMKKSMTNQAGAINELKGMLQTVLEKDSQGAAAPGKQNTQRDIPKPVRSTSKQHRGKCPAPVNAAKVSKH